MQEYTEENLALLAGMLPNISLQLRSTMTNLSAAMGSIVSEDARDRDPDLDQRAAVFYQSYFRLYRLADNLADASQIASHSHFPCYDDDIVGLCRIVCRESEYLFSQRGVALLFDADRDSRIIAMNAAALRRLLMHLLSNALKFTAPGGRVSVRVQTSGASIRISVSDTGCGMNDEQLAHLFDRYLQSGRFVMPPHGLGLGLAICRRIAQGHGGMLVAESEVGKGSTFTLSLPATKCGNVQLRDIATDRYGGFNPILIGLADALDSDCFLQKHMD